LARMAQNPFFSFGARAPHLLTSFAGEGPAADPPVSSWAILDRLGS
jgi:hypothetical protein